MLEDIEFDHNVVRDCRGAGIVVSVEGGQLAQDIRIHHNLLYDNLGTGVFFSRWGDGPRKNIKVYNNTIIRNGCGLPNQGDKYYWITGGFYLFSTNLEDIDICNNIFSENCAIQIGYSESEYQDPDRTHNDLGAFYLDDPQGFWWLKDFPPQFYLKDIQ